MARVYPLSSHAAEAWQAALNAVLRGEVILFPTETVYGLGVDSARPEAVELLYEWKGRPREKPFQWLAANVEQVRAGSCRWDDLAERLAKAFWPGPLTLVVPAGEGTIGWRIPNHNGLLEFLKQLARPLIATSANLSGIPPPVEFQAALLEFDSRVAVALDGGTCVAGVPSTVVEVQGERVRILRPGAISEEKIRDATAN